MNQWTRGIWVAGLIGAAAAWATAAHAAVGRTSGAATVSATGEARYTIPIFAPPGTAGMTPQLALSYGSRGGDNLIGAGWSVAGLSAIYRCDRTWAQDGVPFNVLNTYADRFCRDGSQLRLVTGTYGQPAAEYRTEYESFARIISSGTAGNGPASFTVEQKDGLIYEYGTRTDSQIESLGQTTIRAWPLSTIRDRAGNRIEFYYNEDTTNGSYQIARVDYTANSAAGLSAAYKVEFTYDTQPIGSVESGYAGGSLIKDIKRLKKIETKYNSSLVRSYEIAYEGSLSSAGRSRVASVLECAEAAGTDCYAPTTFTYQNGTSGLGAENSSTASVLVTPLTMDVNGDGRLDLVYSSSATSGAGTWMVMFANTSGYASPVNTGVSNANYTGAISIDYDSNGFYDLLVPYSGGTWWVMYGSASGLSAPANTGAPATGTGANALATDVDGDGREDLVWADLVGYAGGDAIRYRLRVAGGAFSATATTLVGPMAADSLIMNGLIAAPAGSGAVTDLNGDGRGDLAYRTTSRVWNDATNKWMYFYSIQAICTGAWNFGVNTPSAPALPLVGDLNGDGRTDIVYYDQSGLINYRFSTGTSFTSAGTAGSMSTFLGVFAVVDWDGDGYDDIVGPKLSTASWHLWRSTGEVLSLPVDTGVPYSSANAVTVTDVNGDGLRDLGYAVSGAWKFRLRPGAAPDLLLSATDGFGNSSSFTYTPISQGSYTKGSGASFPEQDYQGPLAVVSQVVSSNGIGGTYTSTYSYQGARLDLRGRGFEGFERRRTTDSRNGVYVDEYFQRAFPYTGTISAVETRQSGGTLMSSSTTTWSKHDYSSGYQARVLPYPSSSASARYEVGGAYNGALIASFSTSNTVDSSTGTLTDSTTTVTEANSGNGLYGSSTHTLRTYHSALMNDFTYWCFGRPTTTQQINSHSLYGGSAQTRTVNTSWDAVKCRPTQTVLQPGDPQWQVTTALGYDNDAGNAQPDFGNLTSETVTGVGLAARISSVNWGSTGQFPVSVTNALSQTTNKAWNYALGVQTSETDPNSVAVSWLYDAFGRRSHEYRADGTYSTWAFNLCTAWAGACYAWDNNYYRIDQSNHASGGAYINSVVTFHDPFDRMVDRASVNRDGAQVNERWIYDALGRLSSQSTPFRISYDSAYFTSFTYDLANRVTQASRPVSDSDATSQSTTIYYEGLKTRMVDALGKQSAQVVNPLGRVVRASDHDGYYQGFDFDAFGNPVRVMDSGGATLQTGTYNVRGLRTASTNVDLGSWSYGYNALGEMTSYTDAKSQVLTMTYDALSRPLTRVMPEAAGSITSTWTWGTSAAAREIGRLKSQQISGTGVNSYTETYSFDALGRPSLTRYTEGSNNYDVEQSYSATTGLPDTLTYPTSTSSYRLKLQYEYQYGALWKVKDFNAPSTVFWQANTTDARGQWTEATLGNGLKTTRSLDLVTGWVDYLRTGPGGGTAVQNLTYLWDKMGNLVQRQDNNQGLSENAYYDNLYRLDYTTLNGTPNLDLAYAANGNIQSQSGVGTYTYHAIKLHAVASINTGSGTLSFSYDLNGNMSNRSGTTLTWYASNLPKAITKDAQNSSTFQYGPSGSRWRHDYKVANVTYAHVYLGSLMEKVTQGATVDWKHYIFAEGQAVALYSRKSTGTNTLSYLLRDHQGSVDAITSSVGAVTVRESFNPYGQRRGTAWSGSASAGDVTTINGLTRRGYTGHEMLDSTALIHMNGRVFDPVVARFVSADPYVDAGLGTQGWNSYGYVGNNPLTYVDPSGFATTSTERRPKFVNPNEWDKHPSTNGSWQTSWSSAPSDQARTDAAIIGDLMRTVLLGSERPDPQMMNYARYLTQFGDPNFRAGPMGFDNILRGTNPGPSATANGGSIGPRPGRAAPQAPLNPAPYGYDRHGNPLPEEPMGQSFAGIDDLYGRFVNALLNQVGCNGEYCQLAAMFLGARVPGAARAATISPKWGRNRLEKELRDQGFVLDRPTKAGGGQLFRNLETGAEVRVMQRPEQRFRNDPPAKHESDYYYRSRSGPDQPWGPHTSIPDK